MKQLRGPDEARTSARRTLIGSAAVTLGLYCVPFGHYLAYPLILVSTLVHELGHGAMGILVGGDFDRLVMFTNGSGFAVVRGVSGGWREASVAAGGLVGPAILAYFGFSMVRTPASARIGVWLLTVVAFAAAFFVVRGAFGLFFVIAAGSALGFVAVRRSESAQLVLALLSVQLAASVFSRGDYLFTRVVQTSAGEVPSDVANIAAALGGPYWLWGSVCGGVSVCVLFLGMKSALRRDAKHTA